MAQHIPIEYQDDIRIHRELEKFLPSLERRFDLLPSLKRVFIKDEGNNCERIVMALPDDFVEDKENHKAFKIGNFSLSNMDDENPALTQNIELEVHFEKNGRLLKIHRVYWVV